MPDLITSVGPHKRFPYRNLGCGPAGNCGTQRPYLVGGRPAKTPLRSTSVRIPGGDRGIAQTIRYMYGAVMGNEGVRSAEIRRQALAIVQPIASRDQQGEIATLLQWVKNNIKFRGEYAETIQTPLVTLQLRAGDCDDQAALLAALLGSLGYQTRFRTVAADPSAPWAYSHVFTEVFHRKSNSWVPLDPTVPQSYAGWVPPRVFRSQTWRTMGNDGGSTASSDAASTSSGDITKTQAVLQLITPLSQALSDRIRFGANPPRPQNLNLGLNTSSIGGVSPTVLYVGGAVALGVIVMLAVKGGRS
ncbi:MAG: transglutaminase-like domain-containing protein [Acidobacteriia bacterium]|nr:transglutaminase-like domain-containing protein [Terriglobia bacterium]